MGTRRGILALLQAVQEAVKTEGLLFPAQSLGMKLVVTSPVAPPSNARNYLGGVADVLEDKAHRGQLTHLGPLAKVALHGNDNQLHEVSYRWDAGAPIGSRLSQPVDREIHRRAVTDAYCHLATWGGICGDSVHSTGSGREPWH